MATAATKLMTAEEFYDFANRPENRDRHFEKYEKIERKYPKTLPAVIVEVLSPNDRLGKIIKRIERFLARGVQLAWLIDPESRNVTVFRPGKAPYVLEEDEEIANLPELPGFRCRVAELFEVNED